jgi:hypothetical protein
MMTEAAKRKRKSRRECRRRMNDPGLKELEKLWWAYTDAKKVYDNACWKGYREVDKRYEDLEHQANEKLMVYHTAKKKLRESSDDE